MIGLSMKTMTTAAALLIASVAGADADASDKSQKQQITYATIDGWDILIDMEAQASCYASGHYDSGMNLRIGARRGANPGGYIVLANPQWTALQSGHVYTLRVRFDKEPFKEMKGQAGTSPEGPSLKLETIDEAFIKDFSLRRSIRVELAGKPIAILDLSSSQNAVLGLAACQIDVDRLIKAMHEADDDEENSPGKTIA